MIMQNFHFLQPQMLLALLPLALIFLLTLKSGSNSKAWDKIIDANLLPFLLQGEDKSNRKIAKSLLALGWIICVIALADPVWEKIPRPIFQTNAARVLVLDLSNSMLIDDLKPSRLARARFKIEDILSREDEGQTGLVLFAGDAFTASPLTRDTETIRSLLKILNPQLMPAQGSRVDLGLEKAHELFTQAGVNNGQVLLLADSVSNTSAAINAAKALRDDGHVVSVLGVGTEKGGDLTFRNNQSVSVKLETTTLENIADNGGGKYHLITTNNADLQRVLTRSDNKTVNENDLQEQSLKNEEWKSTGPYLLLLLLPLAALVFRRGWLFNLFAAFVLVGLTVQPQTVMAYPLEKQWQSLWLTLSQNKEQRADSALREQQYEKASELTDDPLRRGSAEYKQGKFKEALESFKQANGADARYNEGNTLAKLKKYKEAIAAYDNALEIQPKMNDAIENKKAVEELLKKQQQSQDSKEKSESENAEKKSDAQQEQSEQQKSEGQQGDQKKQDQQQQGQQSNDNSKDKQQAEEQQQSDQDGNKSEQQQSSKKDSENQFSDANKSIEENEEDTGKEQSSQQQAKQNEQNDEEKSAGDQQTAEKPKGESNEKAEDEDVKNKIAGGTQEQAEELTQEEKMAAEQWLRRIPDDPGGLLRRKFRSQYNQRRRNSTNSEKPW